MNFKLSKIVFGIQQTPEEFDAKWAATIKANNLQANEWLLNLFEIRQMWVPAYVKYVFSAGMKTSERSESICNALKTSISKKNTILEFVVRLEIILNYQKQDELEADFHCFDSKPKLKTSWEIEAHMAEKYTRAIFHIFQEEVVRACACSLVLLNENEGNKIFKVGPRDMKRLVTVNEKG